MMRNYGYSEEASGVEIRYKQDFSEWHSNNLPCVKKKIFVNFANEYDWGSLFKITPSGTIN